MSFTIASDLDALKHKAYNDHLFFDAGWSSPVARQAHNAAFVKTGERKSLKTKKKGERVKRENVQ